MDVLGRYGGDELVALLPDTSPSAAAEVAERLRGAVAATPIDTDVGAVAVRISVGVATHDHSCQSLLRLMGRADAALYRAKEAGRDSVETWAPGMALTPS